jgi:hypothetical protein
MDETNRKARSEVELRHCNPESKRIQVNPSAPANASTRQGVRSGKAGKMKNEGTKMCMGNGQPACFTTLLNKRTTRGRTARATFPARAPTRRTGGRCAEDFRRHRRAGAVPGAQGNFRLCNALKNRDF